jgi:hypothetical protein
MANVKRLPLSLDNPRWNSRVSETCFVEVKDRFFAVLEFSFHKLEGPDGIKPPISRFAGERINVLPKPRKSLWCGKSVLPRRPNLGKVAFYY